VKICEIIQTIDESKGLFGRKIGDTFINDNGQKAVFHSIQIYPETGAFEDAQARDNTIADIEHQAGETITWVNMPRAAPASLAFGIAKLTLETGEIMMWGRYYQSVPKNLIGSWPNGDVPNNWKLQTKSSEKMRSGMTPQDLIATEKTFSNPQQVIDWISKNPVDPAIIDGLQQLANGKMPVFHNQADNFESIRDYLGEIMQPMALMMGMMSGDANKARIDVLKTSWKSCTVMWPQAKNTNLIDSMIISNKGASLGISSKGDKGANASTANIWNAIEKAQKNDRQDLLSEHASMIEIMDIINKNSAVEGPIVLGLRFNLISHALSKEIRTLVNSDEQSTDNLSDEANVLFADYGSRKSVSGYRVGNVLLSNLAKKVSEKINSVPTFGSGCLAFLNQASILQVYTTAKVVGNDVHITNFKCIYPPDFSGTVMLDAGKNYFSSRIAGKLSFRYQA